jgi:hypothetical protein
MRQFRFLVSRPPKYLEVSRPITTRCRGLFGRVKYEKEQHGNVMRVTVDFFPDGRVYFSDEDYCEVCSQPYEPSDPEELGFAVGLMLSAERGDAGTPSHADFTACLGLSEVSSTPSQQLCVTI